MAKRIIPNALPTVSGHTQDVIRNGGGYSRGVQIPAYQYSGDTSSVSTGAVSSGSVNTGASSGSGASGFGYESGLALLNGVTGIVNNFQQLNSIGDTTQQQSQINQMGNIGRYDVNSFEQLNGEYGQLNSLQPNLDYDAIRGGSTMERLGNTLSSTFTGAVTGAQVGGPWGAVAGAAVGLGAGIGGWLMGDAKAEDELTRLRTERYIAQDKALQNLNARMENLADYNFRNTVPRVRAEGGKIERKKTSITEFANSVLGKQKYNDTTRSAGIVRQHCKGGTMIRIKR